MIIDVRQKALDYSQSLSDFLCTQVTHRYFAKPTTGQEPSWNPRDTLTIRVSYFQQKEDYRVTRIDNKPVDKSFEQVGGHRTYGEFGTMLRDIFADENQATVRWERWSTTDNRLVAVLWFRIEQPHSTFQTTSWRRFHSKVTFHWGVEGTLEVDPETHQVVKVSFHAVDIPPESPLKDFQLSIVYGYQKIGEREFLLPRRSEFRESIYGLIQRAETEFTNYRKFSADSDIKFETPEK